ncbi:MAG: 16S rRNA (guanine(527)-N(7))-methyltransferase RsmG [Pseudomonadota bacterium]|nr:16S rRNA (guanine(527)-N(7))-methyltransferase RsmG [Sphingomonas sp.]MDQ3472038.1 16S rRNA (guanine(527)-N(7))-methyltransferase RsmG [Pseudomonadota bacterium]
MIDQLAETAGRDVSRETLELLERYASLLRHEADYQNLIAASTIHNLWERHILDSAQLVRFEPRPGASWVDVGAGAGLPGIVIATLVEGPVLLVEPRRLRAQFLERAVGELGLTNRVGVLAAKAERARGEYDIITARALARLDRLLDLSTHLSTKNTIWVLPKGRGACSELDEARRNWQCEAQSVPSRTDPDSEILLLRRVRAKGKR